MLRIAALSTRPPIVSAGLSTPAVARRCSVVTSDGADRDGTVRGPVADGEPSAMAFAPEAHLPAERRLVVDASGVVLETGWGVRHNVSWDRCTALLLWADRAELVLDDELSIVIRAGDWHRGAEALRALAARAPRGLAVPMPADRESEPVRYVLRGLATSSAVVLWTLVGSLGIAAAALFGAATADRGLAVALGGAFLLAALAPLRALQVRCRVPRRWRSAAAVRGRSSVALDAGIAGASDHALHVATVVLYALAVVVLLGLLALGRPALWPSVLLSGLALAVQRERQRREQRGRQQPGR